MHPHRPITLPTCDPPESRGRWLRVRVFWVRKSPSSLALPSVSPVKEVTGQGGAAPSPDQQVAPPTSATSVLSWVKFGLSLGLHIQHLRMTAYSSCGQSGGFSRRSPSRSTRHKICSGGNKQLRA